MPKASFDGQLR